jgi:hypothetical protein
LQVLGYSRFGDVKLTGKSAYTKIMGQEKIDDPKAGLICQGLENLDEIVHSRIHLGNCLNKLLSAELDLSTKFCFATEFFFYFSLPINQNAKQLKRKLKLLLQLTLQRSVGGVERT